RRALRRRRREKREQEKRNRDCVRASPPTIERRPAYAPLSRWVSEKRLELSQRPAINVAFERDDFIERLPVLDPAPRVELWFARAIETDVVVATDQTQQKPYLLLAAETSRRTAALIVLGDVIAQPI